MSHADVNKRGADSLLPKWLERSPLWHLKVRLQFSGWLQFIPPTLVGLGFLVVAAVAWLVSETSVFFWVPFGIGAAFLANAGFEVVTVKLGFHPPEAIPPPRTDLDAFELIRARHSCRSFQRRNLTEVHKADLLDAVRAHTRPEALLGNRPIRLEYIAAPLTVWPAMGGHEFLVAIAPNPYDRMAVIDVGRSLQKVVLKATRMGVATCWIGPGADQRSIAAHLGDRFDPEADHVICVCAIGYGSRYLPLMIRLMQRSQHRRLSLASLFFADADLTAPADVASPPLADYGRCYEVCQWSPSSYNSQTTRCVAVTEGAGDEKRALRFDFCAATRSRYYAAVALGIWCANWEAGCEALARRGRFEVLSPEARGIADPPEVPHYDVSWVVAAS